MIIGVPLIAGFIGWLTHQQFNQWLAIRDLQKEIGIPDKNGHVQEGSLKDKVTHLQTVADNTNEQVTDIREALILAGIIKPKDAR